VIPGLELSGRHLTQPIPGQTAQPLGCLHLQNRLEILLGRPDVAGQAAKARPYTVCGSWGSLSLERCLVVESAQAAALLAEGGAQVHGGLQDSWDPRPGLAWRIPWPAARRPPAGSLAPGQRRRGSAAGQAGGSGAAALAIYRAGRGPRSRGQIVEEIEIIGILAEELLPADADLQGGHGPALRAGLDHHLQRIAEMVNPGVLHLQ